MKLYWRIRSFPELDHLTEQQKSTLLKQFVGWRLLTKQIARCLLFGVVATALVASFSWLFAFPVGIAVALAIYLFEIGCVRVDLQTQIIEAYRGSQLPICLNCGYDLREIKTKQCPECGKGVRVKVKE